MRKCSLSQMVKNELFCWKRHWKTKELLRTFSHTIVFCFNKPYLQSSSVWSVTVRMIWCWPNSQGQSWMNGQRQSAKLQKTYKSTGSTNHCSNFNSGGSSGCNDSWNAWTYSWKSFGHWKLQMQSKRSILLARNVTAYHRNGEQLWRVYHSLEKTPKNHYSHIVLQKSTLS